MRVLLEALSEGGIAPSAEAAPHVERIGARTVGRSIRSGSVGCPSTRTARAALAVLEQSDLLQAATRGSRRARGSRRSRRTGGGGILESGRPLTFIHPIVRTGIYSELSSAERAQGHRRAAGLLAGQPGSNERVANHLLASEPAGDGWVVERLVEAAREAGKRGAPEPEAVFLRRALAEPPAPRQPVRIAARPRNGRGERRARRLARALAERHGHCAGRRVARQRNDRTGLRAHPNSALRGGGRGSRSGLVVARTSPPRTRARSRRPPCSQG